MMNDSFGRPTSDISENIVNADSSCYTYDNMLEDLGRLKTVYKELFSVNTAGKTVDERFIVEVILGNKESENHILIQASIHGREYINSLLVMRQLEFILQHYDDGVYNGKTYRTLLNNVCFHILPMSNPDGVSISQMGLDGIRSAVLRSVLEECYELDLEHGRTSAEQDDYWKRWKANARGVDLNRNFDAGWDLYESVSHPSSEGYKGKNPCSEREVQAILQVAKSCSVVCVISYHSTGSVVYWDYGSNGEVYQKDCILADVVCELTGYKKVSTVMDLQDAAGCSDYFVLKQGIPAVTIENGIGVCPIDINEFLDIWNANRNLFPALAYIYL